MRPLLPMDAVTIAICNAVARTSNCPMALIAVCGSSGSAGKRDVAARSGISKVVSKPKSSDCSRRASAPSSLPNHANAVLHETASASRRVTLPPGPHWRRFQLRNSLLDCGRS